MRAADEFVAGVAAGAFDRFSEAFDRWRQLYLSAHAQLTEANRKSEMHGLSSTERREAKLAQAQANEQLALLGEGPSHWRIGLLHLPLSGDGRLSAGLQFPAAAALCLCARCRAGGPKAAYLQRARFLAIAEFGPRSLIYHEGRAYPRSQGQAAARTSGGGRRPARHQDAFRLRRTAAPLTRAEPERCHVCHSPMGGIHPIRNVVRIDNVETLPAERITANDEDRQRQGFEIQTVFAWPKRDGRTDVDWSRCRRRTMARSCRSTTLRARPSAESIRACAAAGKRACFGFGIDPATGRWTGANAEEEGEPIATGQPCRAANRPDRPRQ